MDKFSLILFGVLLLILNENANGADDECGIIDPTPRINGNKAMIQLPWHASIYRKPCFSCDPDYVCGGTIVNANVIVTARGCFKNLQTGQDYNIQDYSVAIGKFYRDLYHRFDSDDQQYFTVKTVNYRDGPDYYEDNIATITLDSEMAWIDGVRPVCLNDAHQINDTVKSRGILGHFGTSRDSDRKFSDEMNLVSLDIVRKGNCKRKMPSAIHRFFDTEQLCLKNEIEDRYVRHSVMGEGFTIGVDKDGQKKFYLKGVISNKYKALRGHNEFVILTDAAPAEQFIKTHFV